MQRSPYTIQNIYSNITQICQDYKRIITNIQLFWFPGLLGTQSQSQFYVLIKFI